MDKGIGPLSAGSLTSIVLGIVIAVGALLVWLYRIWCNKKGHSHLENDETRHIFPEQVHKNENVDSNKPEKCAVSKTTNAIRGWRKDANETFNSISVTPMCIVEPEEESQSTISTFDGERGIYGRNQLEPCNSNNDPRPKSRESEHFRRLSAAATISSNYSSKDTQQPCSSPQPMMKNSNRSSPRPSLSPSINETPSTPDEKCGSLTIQLRYDASIRVLHLTVDSCELMTSTISSQQQQKNMAFVKIQFLPNSHLPRMKTKSVPVSIQMIFEETFLYRNVTPSQMKNQCIQFLIVCQERQGNESVTLAESVHPLAQLESQQTVVLTKALKPHVLGFPEEFRGELLIAVCYYPDVNKMTVTIIKARNLAPSKVNGCPGNPYVKIVSDFADDRLLRVCTRCKPRTLRPNYNESFDFEVPSVDVDVLQRFIELKCFIYSRQDDASNGGASTQSCESRLHSNNLSILSPASGYSMDSRKNSFQSELLDEFIGYVSLNSRYGNQKDVSSVSGKTSPDDVTLQIHQEMKKHWMEIFKNPGKSISHWYPVVSGL